MKFKKIVFLIIAFFAAFFTSKFIQNAYSEEKTIQLTQIDFNQTEHNFSTLKKDREASIYFKYKNTGQNPLKISSISSRCGCTIPKWSKDPLLPNQTDSILVSYDAKEMGYFSKEIYVISNAQTSPDVLYIKGMVSE